MLDCLVSQGVVNLQLTIHLHSTCSKEYAFTQLLATKGLL